MFFKLNLIKREVLNEEQRSALNPYMVLEQYEKKYKKARAHNIVKSSGDFNVIDFYCNFYKTQAKPIVNLAKPENIAYKLNWLKHRGSTSSQSRKLENKPFPEGEDCLLCPYWRWRWNYISRTTISVKFQFKRQFSQREYSRQIQCDIPNLSKKQVRKDIFSLTNLMEIDNWFEKRIERIIRKKKFRLNWITNPLAEEKTVDTSEDDSDDDHEPEEKFVELQDEVTPNKQDQNDEQEQNENDTQHQQNKNDNENEEDQNQNHNQHQQNKNDNDNEEQQNDIQVQEDIDITENQK